MQIYLLTRVKRFDAVAAKSVSNANKFFLSSLLYFLIAAFSCVYAGLLSADTLNAEHVIVERVNGELVTTEFIAGDVAAEKLIKALPETVDLWTAMRAGFQLPALDSVQVSRQVNQYISSGSHLQDSFALATPYLYFILEEVKKREMPTELAMLPLLESGFNIRLGKNLNHAGLWGLMPITARHLNLEQSPFKDERRDIIVSTHAALDLLQDLYIKFGDWQLALAAYNWGPASLTKAIEYNQTRKVPIAYNHLRMPVETMAFVPKLMAIRKIIENPGAYNIKLPSIPNKPYFSQLNVKDAIDIKLVIKLAGITQNEFVSLNPSFNQSLIPAGPRQKLLLPTQHAPRFIENYQAYTQVLSPWRTVTVQTPQTLEALAKLWKVDPLATRQLNGLRRGLILQAGTTVIIPAASQKSD